MLEAAVTAFGVVFVAELGDKSQLLALSLAARHGAAQTLAALAAVAAAMMAVSVAAGAVVGAVLSGRWVEVAAGVLFVLFGLVEVRGALWGRGDGEEVATVRPGLWGALGAFALAEAGDKTMLAAASLAATGGIAGTWAGASAGMVASSAIAIVIGSVLGRRLRERWVRLAAAVVFVAVGAALILGVR